MKHIVAIFALFMLLCLQSFSQTFPVKGVVVKKEDSSPLEGITVMELGTKKGTSTDKKGLFSLNVSKKKPTLVFSSVGYRTVQYNWDGVAPIAISMEALISDLEDVVVVGYGTQKKVNLTGSVQTITLGESVNTPVTNAGQLMYGQFSGVQLTQANGLPGTDASSVVIRGIGTFGSVSPLVVIDNIQYRGMEEFNNLSPSDIETISVLKDASASAIYGARGANGVIVVTTKKGKSGNMSIVYNAYTGFQEATVVPKYLDAPSFARLRRERDMNEVGAPLAVRYTDAEIQSMIDGSNPDRFANTKWSDVVLRKAPQQNHYIAISGGSNKTTYRASLGYLQQEAIVKGKFKATRYNMGLNINSEVKNWLTLSSVTNAYWAKFDGPWGGPNAITGDPGILAQFTRSAPTIPVYYSNGELGSVDGAFYKANNASQQSVNPLRTGMIGDYHSDNINLAQRMGLKVQLTKNLSFEASGSATLFYGNISNFRPTDIIRDWAGTLVSQVATNTLDNSSSFNYKLLNENILRYTKTFNRLHDISVMAGHSAIYNKTDGFGASASGFPSNALQEFDAGGVQNLSVSNPNTPAEESVESYFGRINYAYNRKYLFEVNVRRDGTSKFGNSSRWGTFPSASVGWRIREEKFLKRVKWLSDLKLRGSWGITGNDDIGNYFFDRNYNAGLDYTLGVNTIVSAVAITRIPNPSIRWETIEQYDIGLDAGFFNNRLTLVADYFNRLSTDILYSNFPIAPSAGITNIAARNSASMLNRGIEININYKSKAKPNGLMYSIGGSVTHNFENSVVSLGQGGVATFTATSAVAAGRPFHAFMGYQVIGIFQNAADITNSPIQRIATNQRPGDFKYADITGPDGKPDGIVDNRDRVIIGDPNPKYLYNFNGTLNWKGFNFSFVFEGVGGMDRILRSNGQLPLVDLHSNALSYWENRWTPTNTNTNLPRVSSSANNTLISSFYVQDASYLRMKNLEVGYTFTDRIAKKLLMSKCRIYVSVQNFLTFTKMDNFDPERARADNTDRLTPLYKTFTAGLNVKF